MLPECICTEGVRNSHLHLWSGMTCFYINQLPPLKDFLLLLFFKEAFESRHSHQGGFKVVSGVSPVAKFFKQGLCCLCIAQMCNM